MKKVILFSFLLSGYTAFSQIISCDHLSVYSTAYDKEKEMAKVSIYYSDTLQINYPLITSVLGSNSDTLSKGLGSKYYVHMPNASWTYEIPAKQEFENFNKKTFNFQYFDLLGQTGEHTCVLTFEGIKEIECSDIKLKRDTITVDIKKNSTDLVFTYAGDNYSYPNYLFESDDDSFVIGNGFTQTYIMHNEQSSCIETCEEYTPFHFGMQFTSASAPYAKGKFTIGTLGANSCTFPIVYKFTSESSSSFAELNSKALNAFPIPAENWLNVSENEGNSYFLYNSTGLLVQAGIINGGGVALDKIEAGVYLLEINNSRILVVKN